MFGGALSILEYTWLPLPLSPCFDLFLLSSLHFSHCHLPSSSPCFPITHVDHLSKHCSSPSIGTVTAIPTAIVVDFFIKNKVSGDIVYVGK